MPVTARLMSPVVRSTDETAMPTTTVEPPKSIARAMSTKELQNVVVHDLTERHLHRHASTLIATAGRDVAIRECRAKVEKISNECRRHNVKYRDPHFDLSENMYECLYGLRQMSKDHTAGVYTPGGVKRVDEIFENPKFIVDGIDAGDIKQGAAGDCWFLAAISTIANKSGLLDSVCVARDEAVGVYGFIFFRDGDWISEVVDDQLFITHGDYYKAPADMKRAFETEEQYIEALQRGSKALVYARCEDSNETWLPLLEKAYAKVHGDYSAIEAGFTGEGVEDLTGGVTSEVNCRDILDKDRFWKEELMRVNEEFLFAGAIFRPGVVHVRGILTGHAYSVLRAVEANGKRLVQVRNPWGKTEWMGPWSDGSAEWTAEWITTLNHKFGDDGSFWMSYEDFLKIFTTLDRTRIFSSEWSVAQCWTREIIRWPNESFAEHEFLVTLEEKGPVVIVLRQADTRYFVGLEGQFDFHLHFRVRRQGESEYYARSTHAIVMDRSASMELQLEAGTWRVSYKITRRKRTRSTRTAIIDEFREKQSDKFMAVARNFDYALHLHVVHGSKHELEDGDKLVAVPVPGEEEEEEEPKKEEAKKEEPKKEEPKEEEPKKEDPQPTPSNQDEEKPEEEAPAIDQAEPEAEKSNQEDAEGDATPAEEAEEKKEEPKTETEDKKKKEDDKEDAKEEEKKKKNDDKKKDKEEDKEELLDAVVVVGIRVHAQDSSLKVSLVKSTPTTSEWSLDPDDSTVTSFHARTSHSLSKIAKLAK
ncbi:hypothetical protein Poli38472_014285 [Pythium oligandrum]|uniref:Calpain catalytic domain-containing protein n=1 Tax=Pythium oligandrum TaxID=41045 RepID=A0A8K1FN06_PYTOL|nr:hypothetical protein Poli38472_014285 [Pythium oligandrum]|eukprot:TMW64168.1 hypothetical protein Poli38472_014285 [Pythium oligandrum]